MDEEDVPGADEAFERWADRAGFDPGEETEGGRNDSGGHEPEVNDTFARDALLFAAPSGSLAPLERLSGRR